MDNLPGYRYLEQVDQENTFSRDLLASAERYGLYLSTLLDNALMTGEAVSQMVVVTDNVCKSNKYMMDSMKSLLL